MQGKPVVTVCFFGEGAVAEGEFHETMNLAALWQLPVLFACENNRYAMGTALERSEAQTDIAAKATAYNVPAEVVDGMDLLAVEESTRRNVALIREGSGPRLVEYQTYRFRAHSMYDPELYRSKAEVEEWMERDPIQLFVEKLQGEKLISDEDLAAIEAEVAAEVQAAVDFAEASAFEPVEDLERFVYSERRIA
jgi:TPP-dependent pyruvate/acetoin dehydrogenase alpha subunit